MPLRWFLALGVVLYPCYVGLPAHQARAATVGSNDASQNVYYVAVSNSTNFTRPNPVNSNNGNNGNFIIKADLGYVYNFASKWNMDGAALNGAANSTVGYGASLGYTSKYGFGLSADYVGFNNKWNSGGNNYEASFHALTLTPSYRFSLDKNNQWGLRVGLGAGISLSDITWGQRGGGAYAGAISYTIDPGDLKIAKLLVKNPDVDLGIQSGAEMVGGVWSILLKAADGDEQTIDALSNENVDDPRSVTQEEVRFIFIKLLGGWSDGTPPFSFGRVAFRLETTYTAESLGISSDQAEKLINAGVSFGPNIYGLVIKPGTAKDDAGVVLVPQVALEYDNGMLHAEINVRYIHALKNVKYDGTGELMGKTYSVNAGSSWVGCRCGFRLQFLAIWFCETC